VGSVSHSYQYYTAKIELEIKTKDLRVLRFTFNDSNERNQALNEIEKRAFWEKHSLKMQDVVFAFVYKQYATGNCISEDNCLYSTMREYLRQGLSGSEFMISDLNKSYELCASYPKDLIFPASLEQSAIKESASFRSFNRVPTISWVHPKHKATISRCSQPLTGLSGYGCTSDE